MASILILNYWRDFVGNPNYINICFDVFSPHVSNIQTLQIHPLLDISYPPLQSSSSPSEIKRLVASSCLKCEDIRYNNSIDL